MSLSNESLILLSKFAVKAKKHIGLVKVKDMFTNKHYANNILIKASLSDDQELATLTKMVSQQLNLNVIEMNAIEAYITSLSVSSVSTEYIWSSKYYLIILANYLYQTPVNGASYRHAVNAMIAHADVEEQDLCTDIARNFYPFWLNEHQLVAEASHSVMPTANDSNNEPAKKVSLDLWNTIDLELFSHEEVEPLNLYVESLKQAGRLDDHINIRQKFIKLLLKELRGDYSGKQAYRNAVRKVENLFARNDLKEFFLTISREFYAFWAENQMV